MSEPIAQRTLVKSPPELWAEISDVEALARHLGAFGDIRITRMVPETAVSWEGDTARGTVQLRAAGWGTKVTLTATATAPPVGEVPAAPGAPEAAAPPPVAPSAPAILATPSATPSADDGAEAPSAPAPLDRTPVAEEPRWAASVEQKVRDRYVGATPALNLSGARDQVRYEPRPGPANPTTAEPSTVAATPMPVEVESPPTTDANAGPPEEARAPRGFLARLKTWFAPRDAADAKAPPAAVAEKTASGTPERAASAAPLHVPSVIEPLPEMPAAPGPHEVGEPIAAETPEPAAATMGSATVAEGHAEAPATPVDEGTIVGILTGVLDELGSAHNRPFSRG